MTNVTAGAYADVPLFLFHLLEFMDVDYTVDVEEINERWRELAAVDVWSQLIMKEPGDDVERILAAPRTGAWRLSDGGALTFEHVTNDWHEITTEDEAFFLRVYGPGDFRFQGADLGILVTKGRMQTAEGLTERCRHYIDGHPRRSTSPNPSRRRPPSCPSPTSSSPTRGPAPPRPPALGCRFPVESSSGGDRPCSSFVETCGSDAPRMPGPDGRQAMSLGPVEYVILGFPGNQFTGQIVPELAKLIDSGLVRIIDLTFIMKDAAGGVEVVEYDAVEELAAFAGLDAEVGGILTEEDVAHAALSLEPNTSAVLIIWEDTWAGPFAEAVRNANGVILEGARIPREIIEQAMGALADALG